MYDTTELLPVADVPAGTTLLCTGPPMTGKRDLVCRLLGQGLDEGDGVVAVSTDATAGEMQDTLAEYTTAEDASFRTGIVDVSGVEDGEGDVPGRVERVASPNDLRGVGAGFARLAERLVDVEQPRGLRVGILSLSTLSAYTDPETLVGFLHAFTRRVGERDGFAVVVCHDDAMAAPLGDQLRSLVDGEITVRERDGQRELRLEGLDGGPDSWMTMPSLEPPAAVAAPKRDIDRTIDQPSIDSLYELIEDVESNRPTLTLCNVTSDDETSTAVSDYFERLNVDVRVAGFDRETPADVALLHRGPDLLSSASIPELAGAIDVENVPEAIGGDSKTPALLDHLDQTVFGANGADTDLLVQISHTIESLAWRTGHGRLHAGFQRLSRLVEDDRARRVYERIGESDVDVHVYGEPDAEISTDRWTVHEAEQGELTETWFVGFSEADDARSGVLVAEQKGPDQYDGFWSYRPELARRLDAYLRA